MKQAFRWLTVLFVLLGLSAAAAQAQEATAEIMDREGNVIGTATFTSDDDAVRIQVEIEGFEEAADGERGIHIHEVGECEPPDFQSAGGHFNPTGDQHGLLNPDGPHAGDLPNIRFDEDGNASYEVTTMLVTLEEDERSILREEGTSLVIHENPDDHVTDPSGESGDRIACGVIMAADEEQAAAGQTGQVAEQETAEEAEEEPEEEMEEEPEEEPEEDVETAVQQAVVEVAEHETYGEYLTDGEGRALYLFLNDEQGESVCYDQCAVNWPPLLTTEDAEAGEGVDSELLGTIERQDGSIQVTYNDWPLYYFIGDEEPGDVNGQGVGEVWYLVSPEGEAIEEEENGAGG